MKELFLTVLAVGQAHGYELKHTLEREFAGLLPTLNAGQVYTTLARLERDGLVVSHEVRGDTRGKRVYSLTDSGWTWLRRWIDTPIPGTELKNEFFMKLVLAASAGLASASVLIEAQRKEYLQSLRDLDALLDDDVSGPVGELLIEGATLHLRADLEWLDLIEDRLAQGREVN